jgi:type I restriction enzyme S subunit
MTFFKESAFQDFTIGKVPEEWQIESLQALLVQLKNGLTLKQNKEQNGYPITRIETISQGVIDPERVGYVPDINTKDVEEYRLLKGDLLFSHINSVEHIGKVALYEGSPETLFHGMNLLLLRPNKEKINSDYLLYALRYLKVKNLFSSIAKKAVNQASINQTELGKVRIPIPSLPEQRAIVGVLGVVDSAIEYADRVIAKTERLKRGLMQQLLTRGIGHTETKQTPIGKIPKEWEVTKIGEAAETSSGGTPSRGVKEYFDGGIPWVKSGELKDNTLYSTEETISKEGLKNSATKMFPKGTLLIALYGATVGKTTILGIDATTNQAICAILPKSDCINPEFLKYFIISRRRQLIAVSAGGAQPNISQEIIQSTYIPLPPIEEQRKIANILLTVDKKLGIEKTEKEKFEKIKQAMMDLLLTGKVRIKVD